MGQRIVWPLLCVIAGILPLILGVPMWTHRRQNCHKQGRRADEGFVLKTFLLPYTFSRYSCCLTLWHTVIVCGFCSFAFVLVGILFMITVYCILSVVNFWISLPRPWIVLYCYYISKFWLYRARSNWLAAIGIPKDQLAKHQRVGYFLKKQCLLVADLYLLLVYCWPIHMIHWQWINMIVSYLN